MAILSIMASNFVIVDIVHFELLLQRCQSSFKIFCFASIIIAFYSTHQHLLVLIVT